MRFWLAILAINEPVARYAGLTGPPDESGRRRRQKGLARAGNPPVADTPPSVADCLEEAGDRLFSFTRRNAGDRVTPNSNTTRDGTFSKTWPSVSLSTYN
jgi:hypothetical protein